MNTRTFISTVPFGNPYREPLDLLETAGIEYRINPLGRRLKEHELAEMLAGCGVLIAGTEPITERVFEAAPDLQLVARVGIGLDNVDLISARKKGITVSYTPDAPSPAVAELTVGLMLSLVRSIPLADRHIRRADWQRLMGRRLDGLTVGLIGLGRVGKRVARILRGGFPNTVLLGNDLCPDQEFGQSCGIEWVSKVKLFEESDIISFHVPLTHETHRMITAREIEHMKREVFLINTSRGNVIDEMDLLRALRSERIAGAALDVFDCEPYSGELAAVERCILTAHMGSMSLDCRARMELEATQEVVRFLTAGSVQCPVPDCEYAMRAGN